MYPDVLLHIDGTWRAAASGRTMPVINPSTETVIGSLAHCGREDLDEALAAARKGFELWRRVSAFERSKLMRRAANLVRERADDIARLMTLEQGKPLADARI
jgi:succinate-semialdehyde dehydrogenase/glutarate-semialdehyde dehydrogenase